MPEWVVGGKVRTLVLLGIGASMAAGVCLGMLCYWVLRSDEERDLALLRAVLDEVEQRYVDDVPRRRLVDNAIRGLLAGLDDHSQLLDPRTLAAMQERATGAFGGVGLEIGVVGGHLTVIAPLPDTPAARAGIVAGDRLVAVDDRPVKRLAELAQALRGPPETSVNVRVARPPPAAREGQGAAPQAPPPQTLEFTLTRARINLPSARGRLLEPGYGYVRITHFGATTVDDLAGLVEEFAAAQPLLGLIVDLRGNAGGLFAASLAVADAFLEQGVILTVDGRAAQADQRYVAEPGDITAGAALAVLLNRGSASASEVVAGALQDHDRAVVVGTRSYGKTSVQTVMHFGGKRAIKLTTARYVTPAGRRLDETGVTPDIAVARDDGEAAADYRERLMAAALAHLKEQRGAG